MEENNNSPQNQQNRQNLQKYEAQRQAAVNFRREKIEQIYRGEGTIRTPQTTPVAPSQRPASAQPAQISAQNHTNQPAETLNHANRISINPIKNKQNVVLENGVRQAGAVDYRPKTQQIRNSHQGEKTAAQEQWNRYHSAWQNYYQKYYESYYSSALEHHKQKIANANIHPEVIEELSEDQKRERALAKLKQDISNKAKERSKKLRKSRHFAPIIATIVVVLTFLFLQYNRLIFGVVEAYVVPGNANPQEAIQVPNTEVKVGSAPRLIIPKINVDVPVHYGISNDAKTTFEAMKNGLAHFAIPGANSVPGQIGNTVLSGHSSNDLFDGGDYKFIFAQLEKLKKGDVFYADYEGKRYSYVVRETETVLPTEVRKVIRNDGKPWMTLITCTPLGTAEKRFLVFAEQVSPDPALAKPANEPDSSPQLSKSAELPRNSKTFFEKLFSWDWS